MRYLVVAALLTGIVAMLPRLQAAPPKADAYQQYLAKRADARREAVAKLPKPPVPPAVQAAVNNPIDNFIAAKWIDQPEPKLCDDSVFIRRVYLDIAGYVPLPAAVKAFLEDSDPAKRAKLIDQLLARNEDYAANWVPFWEEALCSEGGHQGGVKPRGNHQDWIFESFKSNKPYDVFVSELIDPTELKPRPGFIQTSNHTESTQTAANVAQVFLGTALKCATCHDHFTNTEWNQQQFLSFASLFSNQNLEVIRCETHKGKFVEPRYIFANGGDRPVPKDLNGRLKLAAQLTTDPANPRFAKTIVNRLWKRYLGLGIVEPADDFRADRPGSHPELLDWLAYDFLAHGCDIKHTSRLILNSRTYQLAHDPKRADVFDVQQPDAPRLFLSPALRRLTCEQLLDSIQAATKGKVDRTFRRQDTTPLTRALGRPATRNDISTGRQDDAAVVQALELINGGEFHALIYKGPLVTKLAAQKDRKAGINEVFLAALSRPANEKETELCLRFLGDAPSAETWGDLLWSLVAGPEFQYVR